MYFVLIKNENNKRGTFQCEVKAIDYYTFDKGRYSNNWYQILLYLAKQVKYYKPKLYSITYIGFGRNELKYINQFLSHLGINQNKKMGEELWHYENGKTIKKHIDYKGV